MNYTVLEHKKRGTRVVTSYTPELSSISNMKVISHVDTIAEGQTLCRVTEALNYMYFWSDLLRTTVHLV